MKREKISIDSLILSDGNPRLVPSLGEDEAIANMVNNQKDKLYELASDIIEFGLNPLDLIGVYPSEIHKGFYEVGEGNRRLCVLKLLGSPHKIERTHPNLYMKFSELSKKFSLPKELDVCVFDNEDELTHWMEIRHMGEQRGRGLAQWNSVQKSRFNRKRQGSDYLLDFWDWMMENSILSENEIFSVTKTNWQRVLREKHFPFLKIQNKEGYFVLPDNMDLFKERIRAVQKKLANKTVAIVYDKVQIELFFNDISNELYNAPYQNIVDHESEQIQIKASDDSWRDTMTPKVDDIKHRGPEQGENDEKENVKNVLSETKEAIIEKDAIKIGKDFFNGCSTVIPYHYPIRTSNLRLNKIINELKRINADEFPNACGTLLRTLFELSAKVYLENLDGKDHTRDQFEQAVKGAANALRAGGYIENSQHSAINSDVDNLRKIFNGYMHNTDTYPSSEALKNFFKSHRVFIQECLK